MTKSFFIGKGRGKSMKPVINPGDRLFVGKVKMQNVRVGDIVVFYRGKKLVAHRIIRIKNEQIITKGDNSPFFGKPLAYKEILGKVVKIEGKYGTIDLKSAFSPVFSFYCLFYSLSTYYFRLLLQQLIIKILKRKKV